MGSPAAFWNRLSSQYDKRTLARYAQTYRATTDKTRRHLKPTDRVLDYACGTGITTIELAKAVREMCAIDISECMVNIARSKAEQEKVRNIRFGTHDLFSESLAPSSFDAVMCFNVLYFIEDIDKTLNRVHELLKDAGVFISATDCLGETRTLAVAAQSLLSKLKILPYMRQLKTSELEATIRRAGFEVVESEDLHPLPPNRFVVAIKR